MDGDLRMGSWLVQPSLNTVSRNGTTVVLEPKVMSVLLCLAESPGQPVSKEKLLQTVWPDTFVGEGVLTRSIFELRRVFEDEAKEPRVIQTIAKRGYRLLVPVAPVNGSTHQEPGDIAVAPAYLEDLEVRYQHASDIRADLKRIKRGSESGRLTSVARVKSRIGFRFSFSRWVLAFAGVLLLLGAAVSLRWISTPRPPRPEIKQRRLAGNSGENPVDWPVISPDGKYLAYADDAGIRIKLLATGEIQTIAPPQALVTRRDSWTPAAWFPDSTQLLANLLQSGRASIWTVSILRGSSRLLRTQGVAWSISRDGSRIAFTMPAISSVSAPVEEIWLMGANGEESQRLLAGDQDTAFRKLVWQPDGERLAYLRLHTPSDQARTSIETVTLKDSQPKTILMDVEAKLQDFWYLPEGRIVYSRSRSSVVDSDCDLWQIKSDRITGRALGDPVRLTSWPRINFGALSATASGNHLVFLERISQFQIYIAELAAGGTRLKAEPRRLTHAHALYWPTGWTADSKSVLFTSNVNSSWDVYKQRLDQEDPELLVSGAGYKFAPRISPDGNWVLYTGTDSETEGLGPHVENHILRVPVTGGAPQIIGSSWSLIPPFSCSRTSCVWGEPSPDGKQFLFFEFDPLRGKGRQLATTSDRYLNSYPNFVISPDGTLVAWMRPDRFRILSLKDGKTRDVKYGGDWSPSGFAWEADGNGLLVGKNATARHGTILMHMDLQGNLRHLWKTASSFASGIPSPDGRRLAIGVSTTESNVWMLENF